MAPTSEQVVAVFKNILELDASADLSTIQYNKTVKWDSLGHMSIVAALEEQFDCMLETDEILDMSNIDKAVEIMSRYA